MLGSKYVEVSRDANLVGISFPSRITSILSFKTVYNHHEQTKYHTNHTEFVQKLQIWRIYNDKVTDKTKV